MKVIFLALTVLTAGANAAATRNVETRFADTIIVNLINELRQNIREAGLDPFIIDKRSYSLEIPYTDIFLAQATVENVLVEGLSNIVINRINMFFNRLHFDISLPLIGVSVESANAGVILGSTEVSAELGGRLIIEHIRVSGHISFGLIGGISIRDMDIEFGIGNIMSELNIKAFDRDLSRLINTLFNDVIPDTLDTYSEHISRFLEYLIESAVRNQFN